MPKWPKRISYCRFKCYSFVYRIISTITVCLLVCFILYTYIPIQHLFLHYCFILIHASSCLQYSPSSSVLDSYLLLIVSYRIIFLDPIHPSLQLPIFAPSLSISFVLQLCVRFPSLGSKPPSLMSDLWWTCWPILTVTRSVSRQPASILLTVHKIVSGWKRRVSSLSLHRWCRLCDCVTCRKANQPLSPPPCHLQDTVSSTHKLIKCVTATQSHTYRGYTEARKHTRVVPNEHLADLSDSSIHRANTARHNWVTGMSLSTTMQLKATTIAYKKWVRLLCCQGAEGFKTAL